MATALNEKVSILSDLEDLPQIHRPDFPSEEIQPKHVLELVLAVQSNILKLKKFKGRTRIPPIVRIKKPADVLRIIMACNIILDSLVHKKITPSYPFLMTQHLESILTDAIVQIGRVEPKSSFKRYNTVAPKDVFINAEIMYKTLTTTSHLKFNVDFPLRPYYLPYKENDIKPIHVFTVSVMNVVLLKDLLRRYGLNVRKRDILPLSPNITPSHVYAAYEKILFLTRFFIM